MYAPTADTVSGYTSGTMVDKDASQETTLGSAYSPVDYMSITSFPRLPEDDVLSSENTQKTRKEDDNVLSEQDTGMPITPSHCLQTHTSLGVFTSNSHPALSDVSILNPQTFVQYILYWKYHLQRPQSPSLSSLLKI